MPGLNDPTRPGFHFGPPSGWMNDPNGTIYHKGWYHLFYQWNPYGDTWGNIHWGHARSRDLVTWEHLPPALRPAAGLGEEHCFSGCLALRPSGPPLILYTAIGPQMDALHGAQQWAVLGDDDLLTWSRHPSNPMLEASIHAGLEVLDWRDPFVFRDGGCTYLLMGGKLTPRDGGHAVVLLYEATDPALESWIYRGIFFRHPDLSRPSVECANLFKSGESWVLLLSTHRLVEFFTGDFDPLAGTFRPRVSGLLDGSDNFYATNLLQDDRGRQVCFGWVRGFAPNRGWNGCLALPRLLSVDPDGSLRQVPIPELVALRGTGVHAARLPLGVYSPPGFQGDALEVRARISAGENAFGVRLLPLKPQAVTVTLTCTLDHVELDGCAMDHPRRTDTPTEIHMFLDRSLVEVFVDQRACLTRVLPPLASEYRVEIFACGAATLESLDAWRLSA